LATLSLGYAGGCAAGIGTGRVVHDAVHRLRQLGRAGRHH
jgi:hypothetical protein